MEAVMPKRHRVKPNSYHGAEEGGLRQSLLEMGVIQDLDKMYENIKKKLNLSEVNIDPAHFTVEEAEPQQIELSIEERIQLYRKQKNENKLNERMKRILGSVRQKKRPEILKTPLKGYISALQRQCRSDHSSAYLQDLKHSQQELVFVKNNSKRRRAYTPSVPERFSRSRVISMQTGLPLDNNYAFPPLEHFMKPRQIPKPVINPDDIEKTLQSVYCTDVHTREKSAPTQTYHHHKPSENEKIKDRRLFMKAKKNLNRSLKRAKDMTATFTEYFHTKSHKKDQYKELVDTWKLDRPFTNQLRRKNYSIVGQQKNIGLYREIAEKERQNILARNRRFYSELVQFILKQARYNPDIHLTKHLCEGLRRHFQIFNKFQAQDLQLLLQQAQDLHLQPDLISPQVLHKIQDFISDTFYES